MEIKFNSIGTIKSPYKDKKDIPRQSIHEKNVNGRILMKDEYKEGMKGYEIGDYIIILFHFHDSKDFKLLIHPHGSDEEKGVFATRSPNRPNGIGLTIAQIVDINNGNIEFAGVDMLDNTPVLDIKPYSAGLNPDII